MLNWGHYTKLQSLLLKNNKLETLPDWLSQLTALQELWIHNNPLAADSVMGYLKVAPKGVRVVISKTLLDKIRGPLQGYYEVKKHWKEPEAFQITKIPNHKN
ncbi:leucine-rich repeat domain-containing protein [Candidatus Paracaedibacter symbiosus]|uniref:leucine-rich repeat domain-containing protein n=1 Tax=Candidatus Paracaedibacter symbiosus TaxID=244582 RepID=UPI000509B508|nr:leucine-rich repeat domain-containing protein [Candidatus Paracaedibacter symbiosus]